MRFHPYFLPSFIASVLFMNAGTIGAATCPTSTIDLTTLQIDIPCVLHQSTLYACVMHAAQGVPEADLAWKLDAASLKSSACATETASCAVTSNELGLTLNQLDIDSVAYTAKLAYTQHPDDQSGLYWKYLSHQPESTTQAIDLRVSYYDTYANTLSKKAQIEANLRHFSEALYESSNGAHRLGKVTVFTDGAYADNTDIMWLKDTNDSGQSCWFNSHVAGHGNKGQRIQHCDIGANHRASYNMLETPRTGGYTIGHEWGHFFYGLYDEYQGQSSCTPSRPHVPCSSDTPVDISIMNRHWNALNTTDDSLTDVRWLNFSTIQSGSINNAHYRMYESNGWETLIRPQDQDPEQSGGKRTYYSELVAVAPSSGQTPSLELDTPEGIAAATEALQVTFKPGSSQTTTRRTRADDDDFEWIGTVRQIVIDRSTAVTAQHLDNVKAAVQSLIDGTEIGDVIGIIAFDTKATVIQPLSLIDSEATRDALILAIENIKPSTDKPLPMMVEALYKALQGMRESKVDEKLVHSVYLLTGSQPFDDHALSIAPPPIDYEASFIEVATKLREDEVMLFILANTKDVAVMELLMDVAELADGKFFLATSPRRLQQALAEIQALSSPVIDVTVTQRYLAFNNDVEVAFYLDDSLGEVEINIAFSGSLENLQITLFDPQGTPYPFMQKHCDDVLDDAEFGDEQYSFCTMELYNFVVGQWILQAKPAKGSQGNLFLSVGALPKNNEESFFASIWTLEEEPVPVEQAIIVQASVSADMPITSLQITAMLETAAEQLLPIPMRDDGASPDSVANDGVYTGVFTPTKAGNYLLFADFDNSANNAQYSDFGIAYAPDQEGNVPEQQLSPVGVAFQRFALIQIWVIE